MMNQVADSRYIHDAHKSASSSIRGSSWWNIGLLACFWNTIPLLTAWADEPRNDALWTPPVHRAGKFMPYEQETDEHWMDDRFDGWIPVDDSELNYRGLMLDAERVILRYQVVDAQLRELNHSRNSSDLCPIWCRQLAISRTKHHCACR